MCLCLRDDPKSIKISDFRKRQILGQHFLVDAVGRFLPAADSAGDAGLIHLFL